MRFKTCGGTPRREPFPIALRTQSASSVSHSGEADARPSDTDASIKVSGNNGAAADDAPDSANMTDELKKEDNAEGYHVHSVDLVRFRDSICVICLTGENQLAFCATSACPFVFHESCLNRVSLFDDKGGFYCPCCVLKRDMVKTIVLRQEAALAKRILLKFLGCEVLSKDAVKLKGGGMEEGPVISPVAGTGSSVIDCQDGLGTNSKRGVSCTQDGQVEGISRGPNRPCISQIQGSEISENGRRVQDEDVQTVENNNGHDNCEGEKRTEAPSSQNLEENVVLDTIPAERRPTGDVLGRNEKKKEYFQPSVKGVGRVAVPEVSETEKLEFESSMDANKIIDDVANKTNTDKTEMCQNQKHVDQGASKKAALPAIRHGIEAVSERSKGVKRVLAYEVPENNVFEFESSDLNAGTIEMYKNHVEERAKKKTCPSVVNLPSGISVLQNDGAEDGKKTVEASAGNRCQGPQNSKNTFINTASGSRRRKRFSWSAEEEDMLRKGVQKYYGTIKKNRPWKKILEFGHGVFDPTRSPSNLKDKWKKMDEEP